MKKDSLRLSDGFRTAHQSWKKLHHQKVCNEVAGGFNWFTLCLAKWEESGNAGRRRSTLSEPQSENLPDVFEGVKHNKGVILGL